MPTASALADPLLALLQRASCELPADIAQALTDAAAHEPPGSRAALCLTTIRDNIATASSQGRPLCQDTGMITFLVQAPPGFDQEAFTQAARTAVAEATRSGVLRQNSVDPLTGANSGDNLGPGSPQIHVHPHPQPRLVVEVLLKGGGSDNVSAQYSLPDPRLGDRNLEGVRRCLLHAVHAAQGQGCGPGILGVCIGGDRAGAWHEAKRQLLRPLDEPSPDRRLADLEVRIVREANTLGIGPMGLGGHSTLLGCRIGLLNRVPASYFVTVAYGCWALRRARCTIPWPPA